MSVGSAAFTHLMQLCGDYIDGKTMKITDIDIAKSSVKGKDNLKKRTAMLPADRLIRYNFLEMFVRLARQKYIVPKTATSYAAALEMQAREYLIPHFKVYDPHEWRKRVLWTEENDLAIKRQYRTL